MLEETPDTMYLVIPSNVEATPTGELSDAELGAVAGGGDWMRDDLSVHVHLEGLLRRLTTYVDRVMVDLDVAGDVGPQVGLECYMDDFRQPREEPRWGHFLGHLVDTGLCRPQHRDALLGFPGFGQQGDDTAVWPEDAAAAASLIGHRATSGFARVPLHAKITHRTGPSLEAKAYLGVVHHWLTPARVRVD